MYQVIVDYYDPRAGGAWHSPVYDDADTARTLYAHEAAHMTHGGRIKQVLLTYQGVVVALAKDGHDD